MRLDVATLLRDVAEAVRAGEAREKGVAVELAPLPALMVEGDGEQLKQVVWNLVRNAVQAAPAGGKVMIDGFEQIRHGSRYVVAMVADTGAGIAPGILEKIFNPFFTTKEGGTGLGLSISQRIVHQHKGFIEVRPAPRQGERLLGVPPGVVGKERGGERRWLTARVTVVGAGLAGSEAALRLVPRRRRGRPVRDAPRETHARAPLGPVRGAGVQQLPRLRRS